MKRFVVNPPPTSDEPAKKYGPQTRAEEVEEIVTNVESMTLPRLLEMPASWRQFGARLRAKFGLRAVRPH